MFAPVPTRSASLAALVLLAACSSERELLPPEILTHSFAGSEWSEPVHLDAPVNSPARELGARLSPNELSLYFGSDRTPGSMGAFDIWVSRRVCLECPWGQPVNLGPNINSATGDGAPALSPDGLLLFFSGGAREGGFGGEDIWVSRRTDPNDDLSWGPPVNLGPEVNTSVNEGGPAYVPALQGGGASLYFARFTPGGSDIYEVRVTRDGEALGPAVPVAELNHPTAIESEPTVRADGREIYFWSNSLRGGLGAADLWVATRRSPHDPWSTPQNVGVPVNTAGTELTPGLSWDGRTLLFSVGANARPSLGFQDIWMSTRTPSGR